MSTTSIVKTTSPRKTAQREYQERRKATKRLRRRLEDSLEEIPHQYGAERRVVSAMIDVLYCLPNWVSGAETIIDGIRKLTQKDLLRHIFSSSTSERDITGALIVRIRSPSDSL
jgi:hypothetical protein